MHVTPHVRSIFLCVVVVAAGSLLACNPQPQTPEPSLVGRWRNWSNTAHLVFEEGGVFTLEIDMSHEEVWDVHHGTYQIPSSGTVVIAADHWIAGQYSFALSDEILQLTDASGDREAYKRVPQARQ